jgi:hypothetical protein
MLLMAAAGVLLVVEALEITAGMSKGMSKGSEAGLASQ